MVDENESILALRQWIKEAQTEQAKSTGWRLMVLHEVLLELQAEYTAEEILNELTGIYEFKYVFDDADRKYLADLIKKAFTARKGEG
jgi:type III secretory pathway component EscV